jgi:hypothetical protein
MRTIKEVVEQLRTAKFNETDELSILLKNRLLDEILDIYQDEQSRCLGYVNRDGIKDRNFD